ncbi:MAG: hypothetical protein LBV17_03095 [Treponema sp.]|nr:hypothetical protein [Treponema sp.]
MNNTSAFLKYLADTGKRQAYIDMSRELLDDFYVKLGSKKLSSREIDIFIRGRWSGYISRDKAAYQILNDYADFCEAEIPAFKRAFGGHVRETFEAEARKAMKSYKKSLVYIPADTRINASFLGKLKNDKFVTAFYSLQKLMYAIYDEIENGSPFDWGWLDWRGMTAEGLNHNRVMMLFAALAGSGHLENESLCVDKKNFSKRGICKPMANTRLMLNKLMDKGFRIEGLDDKKSIVFTVSFPDAPNLIAVLYAYFKSCENRIKVFSYRFMEDPAAQTRETYFLAITDGVPEHLRKIYYWLYDEAVKYGFKPMGYENMGCYVYKKGATEWLLLGSGSSYHEDEFLHSVNYAIAVKTRFHHVFQTHPEKIGRLKKRFPDSFGRPWTACFNCKANSSGCKNRVTFKKGDVDYHHCGTKHHLYFHDPDLNDVKHLLELYKLENKIK